MGPHYFTTEQRREQLKVLMNALATARQTIAKVPNLAAYADAFVSAEERTRESLNGGFEQSDLRDLFDVIPDPLGMRGHPRCEPPLEPAPNGSWQEAKWFRQIEPAIGAVKVAAANLKTIGCY